MIDGINWQKNPLIPTIVQEHESGDVLMLAYMNKEALELTLSSGFAHYFSRSKQRIWKKGEESGNVQKIENISLDCDSDTLLLQVQQSGVACHTGRKSCFFKNITSGELVGDVDHKTVQKYSVSDLLYHTILDRKNADPQKSYTAQLFSKGENTILKKVAEEAAEFCLAVKDNDTQEIIYEAADLMYHMLVALGYKDISPQRIDDELRSRFGLSGIEEKNSRT